MKLLFNYLIFPGLVFMLIAGMIASWIERKVTARVQWRVGPPLLQPLYDVLKLFTKENVIPENAHLMTFISAPVISFASVTLAATIIGMASFFPAAGFQGDLLVVMYLLVIPGLCLILGGAASANPLASLGAAREMKLILSYELVFWTAISVVLIKTGGIITLSELNYPPVCRPAASPIAHTIAFILTLVVMQAKLGRVPFDVAEAETEIMAGPYIEYSGPLLGFFKMSQYILLVALPMFVITVFWGGINSPVDVLKYVALLVIIILAENTNPRLKITQCLKLFWFILFPMGLIAIILALKGF